MGTSENISVILLIDLFQISSLECMLKRLEKRSKKQEHNYETKLLQLHRQKECEVGLGFFRILSDVDLCVHRFQMHFKN